MSDSYFVLARLRSKDGLKGDVFEMMSIQLHQIMQTKILSKTRFTVDQPEDTVAFQTRSYRYEGKRDGPIHYLEEQ